MAGQVMEAHHQGRLQPPAMPPSGCKHDVHHLPTTTAATAMAVVPGSNAAATVTAAAADMAAYLQQLQDAAAAAEATGGPLGGGAGEAGMQMQSLGLRGGGGGPAGASSSGLFWPAGLLDNDSLDTWKMLPGAGVGAAMWPDFSAATAAAAQTASGLLHGGAQLM
ncbi:dof zinc finger protein DOF3.4-like [Panicum miliaceum]|uniref:Dof zinc finger protein DOF3.4-like n=1 Tax=Panicum miliaceum TaxID=4540 RepID=A0A3L6TSE3_PANMI|nr:dof zinc finger protein DOF3.4-like [Panicum miliaceum]